MKKTILVLVVLALFIITTFADANVLKIKNCNLNPLPETPSAPLGSTFLKVGYSYDFIVSSFDFDGDRIQYQFDWDSTGFKDYSCWTELSLSAQTINFSHSWSFPGIYVVKVRAQDEHGAISTWSDGLTVTVNYENQRRNIMLTGFWQPTSQMIVRFSTDPYVNPDGWQGENWENLGYDIYSFVAKEYYNNNGTWEMSYQQIWNEYWDIVNQLHPVAIIGFFETLLTFIMLTGVGIPQFLKVSANFSVKSLVLSPDRIDSMAAKLVPPAPPTSKPSNSM